MSFGLPISVDGTFASNSDALLSTQKATKTYVDAAVASGITGTTTQYATLVGAGPNLIDSVGPSATAGQIFQSGGGAANPSYSTATYPAVATGTGTILRADGTNWVATTATYPTTLTVNNLLYASATDVVSGLTTANNGTLVTSNTGVPSILAGPGTTGNILQSNAAAAPSFSSATYPSSTTANRLLYSSATNVVGEITTTADRFMIANASGVPSWTNTVNVNLSISGSSSGGTRSVTAQNTSNTASSNGGFIAATSGTSAGDPFYRLETGSTTWVMGSDNSVTSPSADPWTLSNNTVPGTNDVIVAYTTGEVTKPLQPAFLAYLAADVANVTGDGTAYQLGTAPDALTELFDRGNDFNTNGTFTAPVTGLYQFNLGIKAEGVGAETQGFIQVITTARAYRNPQVSPLACKTAGNELGLALSVLADMTAGDTATASITFVGGALTTGVGGAAATTLITYFSGYLVC